MMRIVEVVLGVLSDGTPLTFKLEPRSSGPTFVPLDGAIVPPPLVAQAIRETLAAPERLALSGTLPFLRVTLTREDPSRSGLAIEIAVADDASSGRRMLTETRASETSLMLEARTGESGGADRDARMEAILGRVAAASGLDDPALLVSALAEEELREAREDEPSEEEVAYLDAHRRAAELTRAVRAIDDRMTASVVPDWLWVATGVGGVGVFMTVIALLYPHLRILVVAFVLILSLLGFTAYGVRSLRELKTRSMLQLERADLRARRQEARKLAGARGDGLRARGLDPDEIVSRLAGFVGQSSVPAVVGRTELSEAAIGSLSHTERQIIIFIDRDKLPPYVISERIVELTRT